MEEEVNKVNIIKTDQERTIEKKAEFLEEYPGLLGIITATCQKIGIDRGAYYKWMDRDEIFKQKIKKLGIQQRGDVEDRLVKAIASDNIAAIIFYLKSKHPDYKIKIDAKIEGKISVTANTVITELGLKEEDFEEKNYEQTVKRIAEYYKSRPNLQTGQE